MISTLLKARQLPWVDGPWGNNRDTEVKVITHLVSVILPEAEKALKITFLHVMTGCSLCIYGVFLLAFFLRFLGSLKKLESFSFYIL